MYIATGIIFIRWFKKKFPVRGYQLYLVPLVGLALEQLSLLKLLIIKEIDN